MAVLDIGAHAPSFRLPSAQGPVVDLHDVAGRGHVVLWFTKGFGCPFCRQQMSYLIRALPAFRAQGAELLVVTRTTLDRAQMYARRFDIAVPYLCDADGAARRAYGLEVRSKSATWYLGKMIRLRTSTPPASDFGGSGMMGNPDGVLPSPAELIDVLADEDTALFVIERGGVVRFVKSGAMRANGGVGDVWQLPTADDIVRVLKTLAR